ncbi:uncharacterized protein FOMMEDRAFT_155459 [Fomitiporia mediterranea MF3/22]|uniref:uncharacterized protein n=1 Tax=Fomitiporia mediterranea (strain MF3/22) TaxID=694068 RepID=UPI00044072E7|nr:uncharacterized protein FOMMEDRAFT_155459 [Fomitiporia mediterranea MF3/22]EJD04331.1 hypothetical protein FOMMEDRAFT_155459 [Fomitiporia mediterranea MF3/22]
MPVSLVTLYPAPVTDSLVPTPSAMLSPLHLLSPNTINPQMEDTLPVNVDGHRSTIESTLLPTPVPHSSLSPPAHTSPASPTDFTLPSAVLFYCDSMFLSGGYPVQTKRFDEPVPNINPAMVLEFHRQSACGAHAVHYRVHAAHVSLSSRACLSTLCSLSLGKRKAAAEVTLALTGRT